MDLKKVLERLIFRLDSKVGWIWNGILFRMDFEKVLERLIFRMDFEKVLELPTF